MIRKMNGSQFRMVEKGPFKVNLIQPGRLLDKTEDFAFGPLARFDHANANVGTFVKMHDHINDEIISYMWQGEMIHDDSTGDIVKISDKKLMLMNSGSGFRHEESVPEHDVEMLQIFIRPSEADLPPQVQFYNRPEIESGPWHLLGGPETSEAPLKIRQDVYLYDAHLLKGDQIEVLSQAGLTPLVYVMDGAVQIGEAYFVKGDLLTDLDQTIPRIEASEKTTLALFMVNLNSKATTKGLFSGIQR